MKKHKLALDRETLRHMEPRSLERIYGGLSAGYNCQTATTTSVTTTITIISGHPDGRCAGPSATPDCHATVACL